MPNYQRIWANVTVPLCSPVRVRLLWNRMSSSEGWYTTSQPQAYIYVGPHCMSPTYS